MPYCITNLPKSEEDINNDSRNRKGYHTYISHFFSGFELLSKEEQDVVLVDNADDVTVDSVMTPRTEKAYEFLKAASIRWRNFSTKVQTTWKERAAALNLLPVKGKVKRMPRALKLPLLNNNVIDSLKHDWRYIWIYSGQ